MNIQLYILFTYVARISPVPGLGIRAAARRDTLGPSGRRARRLERVAVSAAARRRRTTRRGGAYDDTSICLWFSIVWYGIVWYGIVWYSMV